MHKNDAFLCLSMKIGVFGCIFFKQLYYAVVLTTLLAVLWLTLGQRLLPSNNNDASRLRNAS
jgi:hypothetical protein